MYKRQILAEKMKELLPSKQEELKKIREEFESLEKTAGTWFYPVLLEVEDYGDEVVGRFVAEYRKKGFEFSIKYIPCPWEFPRIFLASHKDYYRHRNDKKKYLQIVKTDEVGVFGAGKGKA